MLRFLFVLLSLNSNFVFASMLQVKVKGERVGEFSMDQLKTLQKPTQVEVFEPHENRNRTFTAIAFKPLMEGIFGKVEQYKNLWNQFDDVTFHCLDGYQATLDLKRVLKYDTYLAFGDPASESFLILNTLQNNEKISAAPFYLIWNNLKSPELKKHGANGWPYQVTTIEFVNFKDKFPKTAPDAKASDDVREGFRLFREKCLACHKINGEGGEKGPELNHPVSVTQIMKEEWLYQWIRNPLSVRSGSTMPAYQGGEAEIKQIVSYLKHKAKK